MPGSNLSREEARERANLITVDTYFVNLDLTDSDPAGSNTRLTNTHFATTSKIKFSSTQPGASTFIDLLGAEVSSVTLNGTEVDGGYDGTRVYLDGLAADNVVEIVARAPYSRTGEGLHRFVDPVDGRAYLYTQFESTDARRMYACFDQPDLKATYVFDVTAPASWQVVSNSPTPDPVAVRDDVARWTFAETKRMSTYITALVAGEYHVVRSEYAGPHGTYPLGIFCRQSLAEYLDPDDIFTSTHEGFAFFEESFALPYPFGKYDQLFVPEYNAGAMENAGCVTFHEDLIFRSRVTDYAYESRSNTILHEMAHMWFGDLVTMRWWNDLWLNESFAEWASTYANSNATRFTEAWTNFAQTRKGWAYRQDQLSSTHPIASEMPDIESVRVNFDGITYAKGASALRQLVAWVGEKEFIAGLRAYFAKHAWGNTELIDLLTELSAASGRDLSEWSAAWLETAGVNELRPEFTLNDDGTFASMAVKQLPPSEPAGLPPVLRPHRIGVGLYDRAADGMRRRSQLEIDVVGELTQVDDLIGMKQPDLLLLNDGDLTFAKVRLDKRSLQTMRDHLGEFDDSLARALCWSAAWDMLRDGEMSAHDYQKLVLGAVERETSIAAVQQNLRQAHISLNTFADPAWRDQGMREYAVATQEMLSRAKPGTDEQLVFARMFVSAAKDDVHVSLVRALLDGSHGIEGLAIDTDMRWALLQRLVATGHAGTEEIDAELARDNTATGARHAAVARASRPTAEAKAEAWRDVMETADLPNALQLATIMGFMSFDHVDLIRPYVTRYLDVADQAWSTHSNEMASNILVGLYPSVVIEEATVRLTEDFLARDGLAAPVRRLVGEGRDGVVRALKARAFDIASH